MEIAIVSTFLGLALVGLALAGRLVMRRMEQLLRLRDIEEEFGKFEQALTKAAEGLEMLPGLMNGLQALCKTLADKNDVLVRAVATLEHSILPDKTSPDYEDYSEEMPEDRVEAREIRDLVRQGVPRKEAEGRVRERRLYSSLTERR